MHIDIHPIRNKQRIYIGGNSGAREIFDLTRSLVQQLGKPADFYIPGQPYTPTDAPVVIIRGSEEPVNGKAGFQQLDLHILLIHRITEDLPAGYQSFEEYVSQYEQLADALPRAGTYFFFEGSDVATLIGKKEREDVKNIEYAALKQEELINVKKSADPGFPEIAGGVRALLGRIGVSQDQFFQALNAL